MAADSYLVGAYWGPRGEPVEVCAARFARQLAMFSGIDPLLAKWFKQGRSRTAALKHQIDPSVDALRELLLAGVHRKDFPPREVITELGYSAGMWNGQDAEAALSVGCGITTSRVSNVVVLDLPKPEGAGLPLYRRDAAMAVIRAVVEAWQPTWCTWISDRLRDAQGWDLDDVVAGWATYVAQPRGTRLDRLPPGVAAEDFADGLLLIADGDANTVSENTVKAIREALGDAIHPDMTSPTEPPSKKPENGLNFW